jgi:hypothetical protein
MSKNTSYSIKFLLTLIILFSITACDNSNSLSKAQNDGIQRIETATDMLNRAKSSFTNKDSKNALLISNEIVKKFSGSKESIEANQLIEKINLTIAEEKNLKDLTAAKALAVAETLKVENEKKLQSTLKNFEKKVDEISDVTFYTHKKAPKYINSRSVLSPYIVIYDGAIFLKLQNIYVADDWLFIEKYLIKADEEKFEITPDNSDVRRDNSAGDIWEWVEKSVTPEDETIIRAISKSKKAVIRYYGQQYYKDRVISQSEKDIIKETLLAYDLLNKK